MALIDTVKTWVLDNLPYNRDDPDVVAALEAKTPPDLLITYLNWQSRLIPQQPRNISKSTAFEQNPVARERQAIIAEIINDVKVGNALTKFLSRGVRYGFTLPRNRDKKQLERRRDLDLLLNDLGIYHLHISTEVEADGFVRRGGPIIFAIFKPGRAYLIDIMNYGDRSCERVILIVVDNWAKEGLVHKLKGVLGTQKSWTDEERGRLRGAGMSTLISVNGRTFLPGTGISTAGTSTAVSLQAMRIIAL